MDEPLEYDADNVLWRAGEVAVLKSWTRSASAWDLRGPLDAVKRLIKHGVVAILRPPEGDARLGHLGRIDVVEVQLGVSERRRLW